MVTWSYRDLRGNAAAKPKVSRQPQELCRHHNITCKGWASYSKNWGPWWWCSNNSLGCWNWRAVGSPEVLDRVEVRAPLQQTWKKTTLICQHTQNTSFVNCILLWSELLSLYVICWSLRKPLRITVAKPFNQLTPPWFSFALVLAQKRLVRDLREFVVCWFGLR